MSKLVHKVLSLLLHLQTSLLEWLIQSLPQVTKNIVSSTLKNLGLPLNGPLDSDIQVLDDRFYAIFALEPSSGFGNSYVNGYIQCKAIDEYFYKSCKTGAFQKGMNLFHLKWFRFLQVTLFRLQDANESRNSLQDYYDFGNDWFETFLGPSMCYSCGYWKGVDNLDEAQYNKMDLIARKLQLKPGMRVLDIGCGWGALCKFLAEKYQVSVVGCTLSPEQVKYGMDFCKGLDVDIRVQDFREVEEKFDRVVSVAMFEHLGEHNLRVFFESANKCLKDDGLFLLHTIVSDDPQMPNMIPFFHKSVFPNHTFPYYINVMKALEGLFTIEDVHNFGHDYSRTFKAWNENLHKGWQKLRIKYDEKQLRLWTVFFLGASAPFKARKFQLWHLVMSKGGVEGVYESVR